MKKNGTLLLMVGLLAACATGTAKAKLPYDAWYLGFFAPPHMDVWVETADVEDINGVIAIRAGGGATSVARSGDPRGWPGNPVGGGREVRGTDLPKRIYVRRQSLVEPQTYRVTLEIPQRARDLMLSKVASDRVPDQLHYRNLLIVGLAPGGVAKAWVRSQSNQPIEVLCQQAEIEPKGPSQGLMGGRYAYSLKQLEPSTQEYVSKKKIPYESWKCPVTVDR
ncbi:MAG: hypothetical protein GAK31_02574 [Stenotrophomonas maltophilia]|uniref:DUF2931 family protein n=1 Tax=Stenotrophomonas maltophilia TaxID=40324 RepID=A0A7V8FGE0_STEMA|nr:MAG: hypothetical protein GAK31_02574 [Stenotrophomonas maltophilia]